MFRAVRAGDACLFHNCSVRLTCVGDGACECGGGKNAGMPPLACRGTMSPGCSPGVCGISGRRFLSVKTGLGKGAGRGGQAPPYSPIMSPVWRVESIIMFSKVCLPALEWECG